MKKIILALLLLLPAIALRAQVYDESNSLMRKALVLYQKDAKGFYQKSENISIPVVNGITESYAYDKKSHELYVKTNFGNCVITVADNYAKFLKKNKNTPQIKGEELASAISRVNMQLEEQFNLLNTQRQQQIVDSIAKAKADSIKRVKQDSIRLARIASQKETYRKNHSWRWVPISRNSLSCSLCSKSVYSEDSIFCLGYRNDTLYHVTSEEFALDETYLKIHPMHVSSSLKTNEKFRYHFEVYGDSLRTCNESLMDDPDFFNYMFISKAADRVKAEAPYGYFNNWGWDSEYGAVSFHFEYTNTNKATIKYIDVYWTITNDVNDVRKTGHFKGTGPLEEWKSASWNWDYSSYYVAGDASNMQITKVILTYSNGTQKTLSKSMLRFD